MWLTKKLLVKIAEQNLLLLKVNRNFTEKRDLTMNRKDALSAEELESSKETATEAMGIDTNKIFISSNKSGFNNPLLYFYKKPIGGV